MVKEIIKAEVVLSLNRAGEHSQKTEFISNKVSLVNLDETTMVLSVISDDGVSVAIKFNKDEVGK